MTWLSKNYLLVFMVSFLTTSISLANPVLSSIASGNVTIQQTNTNKSNAVMTINQTSQQAILNWQSFNIGSGQATHFIQPQGGIALNRISPEYGPSQIYGLLTATGQIILINPAGIYFGPNSVVNVGGMIATTSNITDQNFLNGVASGKYIFNLPSSYANASIINQGTLVAADHGLIALVGPNVTNDGMIEANLGHVILASGDSYTVNFAGNDMVNFAFDNKPSSQSGSVTNTNNGSLIADGGHILVTAQQTSNVLDNAINLNGVVQARSVYKQKNGDIVISGDPNGGVVNIAANINASGKKQHQTGGNVNITGYNILIDSPTLIDVSGDAGGGTINIGGNLHGLGPLPNANAVVMAPGAILNANAITNGNGGQVVLWSNDSTTANGLITAQGGSLGGNGGFIETSSHHLLNIDDLTVNTLAANGNTGTWLLDPTNLTISTGATANVTTSGSNPVSYTGDNNSNTSILNTTTLDNQLGLTNVDVVTTTGGTGTGTGQIIVASPISWTSASGNSLTLTAADTISINAGITIGSTSAAQLILNATGNVTQSAVISGPGQLVMDGSGTFTASRANTYTGGTTINSGTIANGINNALPTGTALSDSGTFNLNGFLQQVGSITGSGTVTNSSGTASTFTINNASSDTFAGLISNNLALTKSGAGNLTLSNANTYTGDTTINAGTLSDGNVAALPSGAGVGNVIVNGTGTLDLANFSPTINGLSGTGIVDIVSANTADTFTVGANNASSTFSGTLQNTTGTLSLVKTGSGTLTLAGNNTLTGTTTVNAGTLSLTNANALGITGAITVNAGTSLNLDLGSDTLANNSTITLNGNGVGGVGALDEAGSGSDTVQNPITLGSAASIGANTGSTLNLSGNIANGSNLLTFTGDGNFNESGVIGNGAGGLTMNGTGTLTLSGANTYTGGTTINSGTILLGNSSGIGTSGTISITPNASSTATLDTGGLASFNNGSTINMDSSQAGSTAQIQDEEPSGNVVLPNAIVLTGTNNVIFINSNSIVASGGFTGTGGLTVNSTDMGLNLYLNAANNTYSGTTTILGGSLIANAVNALSANSAVVLGNNAISRLEVGLSSTIPSLAGGGASGGLVQVNTGSLTIANANPGSSTSYAGVFQGKVIINLTGTGFPSQTFTGTNTMTNVTVNAGTLVAGNAGALGTANISLTPSASNTAILDLTGLSSLTDTSTISFNSSAAGSTALLSTNNSITLSNAIGLTGTNNNFNVAANTTQLGGAITGTGNLTKLGAGTLQFSGTSNTYSGTTTINAGTLQANATNSLSSHSAISLANVAGVILDLNGFNNSISSLAGGSVSSVTMGSGNLTIANSLNGSNTSYDGVISGSGAFTINLTGTGSRTQTLTNSNAFTGTKTVDAGVLSVTNANGLGTSGAITVNSGTLSLNLSGGTLADSAAMTLNGSGIGGVGALYEAGSGSDTVQNPITLGSAASIGANTGSTLNLSGNIANGSNLLTFTGAGNFNESGVIGNGAGGLTMNGTGTLTLSAANTYTGNTTISAGTLSDGNVAALPSGVGAGNVIVNGTGTLDLANFSPIINGLSGTGIVDIVSANTADTFTVGANNASSTFTGKLKNTTGTLSLVKTGSGTLTLAGNNTLTGTTTVNAGTLSLTNANALGTTGAIAVNAGTLSLNLSGGTLADSAAMTLNGSGIGGVGALYEAGSGSDSVQNPITLGSAASIGANTGSTLNLSGNIANGSNLLTFTGDGNVNESGVIGNGAGGLTMNGTGNLTLSAANTYTGDTTISAGTLSDGNVAALPSGAGVGNVIVNGTGTLDLANFSPTINGLSGTGIVDIVSANTADTFTVGANNASSTFSGTLQNTTGTLSLVKTGSGTLTLAGNNTLTGTTTVNAGTLSLTNANALGITGAITVNAGTSLNLDLGSDTLANNSTITLNGNGVGGVGALDEAGSGSDTVQNPITLGSAASIGANTGSTLNLSGNIANGSNLLTFTGAGNFNESGVIGNGAGGLTMNGTGTLTLSAANTYTGNTTISSGTIANGINNALPTGTALSDSGTLNLNGFSQQVGSITGSGTVTNSSGTARTFTINNASSDTFAGLISNNLALTKSGAGNLTLSNANTYTGATTISAGMLSYGNVAALPSGAGAGNVTVNGTGTLDLANFSPTINGLSGTGTIDIVSAGTADTFTVGANNASSTFTGKLQNTTGTLSLVKTGSGTLTLSKANTYTGATTISVGTIANGINNALPTGTALSDSGTFNLNGFLQQVGSITGSGTVTNSSGTASTFTINNASSDTFAGLISNNLALTKSGAGNLTLSNANTYTGDTTINAGTLSDGNVAALPSGAGVGNVIVNGTGTLDLANFSPTINGLSGTGIVDIVSANTADTFTVGANNASSTFSGTLQNTTGTLSLVKTGSGTLTLAGNNTLTGTTTVNAGTLSLTNANALGITGAITVNAGTSLSLDLGSDTLANNSTITLNGNGVGGVGALDEAGSGSDTVQNPITLGSAASIGANTGSTLNLSGNIANGSNLLTFTGDGNFNESGVIGNGAGGLTMNGTGNLTLSAANTYTGNTTISAGTLSDGNVAALPSGAGAGNVIVNGTGTLDLANFSQTINALSGTGTIDIVSANTADTFTVGANNASSTFSGTLQNTTGTLSLVKTGSGTLTLAGNNTLTGTTTVNAGTLSLTNANALGTTGAIAVNSGTLSLNLSGGTLADSAAMTLNGSGIGGVGALYEAGSGSDAVQNPITLGSAASIGANTGSTLNLSGNIANGSNLLTFTGAGNVNESGVIGNGAGGLTMNGTGNLTLSAANTYTGDTTISAGTLSDGNVAALPSGAGVGNVIVNGTGTLDLANFSPTINGLSGTGIVDIVSANTADTFTVGANNASSTFSGTLQNTTGTLSLVKTGSGTLTLAGNNTLTGTTTVNAGTLSLTNANALGTTGAIAVNAGTLSLNLSGGTLADSAAMTLNGSGIGGVGALYEAGSGSDAVQNPITLGSAASIGANTGSTLNLSGNIANGSNLLTFTGDGNVNESGVIGNGAGGLTMNGTGNLTLSAANTYTGDTTISAGTLSDGNVAALPSGAGVGNVIVNGTGTLDLANFSPTINGLSGTGIVDIVSANTADTFTVGANNASSTFSGTLQNTTGTLSLVKTGSGTLTLAGNNTLTGTTTVNAGTLSLTNANALGTTGAIVVNAGTLNLDLGGNTLENNATITLNGNGVGGVGAILESGTSGADILLNAITLGSDSSIGTNTGSILNITNSINSGTHVLTYAGTGSFGMGGSIATGSNGIMINGPTLILSGTNTYTGATIINSGGLEANAVNVLSPNSDITLANSSNASLNLNGFDNTIASLSGGGAVGGNVMLGGGTLTIASTANGSNTNYAGVIGGNGGVTVDLTGSGSPVQTLSGANTYNGNTTINAGTLQYGNAAALPSGAGKGDVIINNNGILDLSNFSPTINGLSGSGVVDIVSAGSTNTLSIGGNNVTGSFSGTLQNTTGTLNLVKIGSGTLTLSGSNTYSGSTTVDSGTLVAANANALSSGNLIVNTGANLSITGVNIGNNVTLNDSTLSSTGTAGLGGTITLGNNTNDFIDASGNFTIGGAIDGNADLTFQGAGTVTLLADVGSVNALSSLTTNATLNIGATIALNSNNLNFNSGITGNNLTLNGPAISLAGPIAVSSLNLAGTGANNSLTLNTGTIQTWNLTGSNGGNVASSNISGSVTFSNMQNITGGSANDSFILSGGTVTGNINGGGGTNSFTANNVANTWNITGTNTSNVTGVGGVLSNIQNLIGGNAGNQFTFADNASITGTINGGNPSNTNTLDYQAYSTPVNITLTNNKLNASVMNNSNQVITNYTNINDLEGNSSVNNVLDLISVPSAQLGTVTINGLSGSASDPLSWSGFTALFTPSSSPAQTASAAPDVSAIIQQPQINGSSNNGTNSTSNASSSDNSSSDETNTTSAVTPEAAMVSNNINTVKSQAKALFDTDLSKLKILPYCH